MNNAYCMASRHCLAQPCKVSRDSTYMHHSGAEPNVEVVFLVRQLLVICPPRLTLLVQTDASGDALHRRLHTCTQTHTHIHTQWQATQVSQTRRLRPGGSGTSTQKKYAIKIKPHPIPHTAAPAAAIGLDELKNAWGGVGHWG